MFGRYIEEDDYHVNIVRNQLTRSLTSNFEEVCDEIGLAFQDNIPQPAKAGGTGICSQEPSAYAHDPRHLDWVGVYSLVTMQNIVCRASNRIFVGVPLCTCLSLCFLSFSENFATGRDPEWVKINVNYTIEVANKSQFLRKVPSLIRP